MAVKLGTISQVKQQAEKLIQSPSQNPPALAGWRGSKYIYQDPDSPSVMSIPSINLATIRCNATPQSFERGEQSYRAGAVAALTQWGNLLQVEVEGSEALRSLVVLLIGNRGGRTPHLSLNLARDLDKRTH
jgi:hypothetical protein